ncbi:MAG: RES domain-containing protein [Novosphingobium sp.]|nr:RES domain-containing protein [Novosphingobium sp.]MBO9603117.1 RES domain-containing protein [Novosphingobium sp.]
MIGPGALTGIDGHFFRAVLAGREGQVLDPPGPHSAGRYHRPGQRALYITPEADWAAIAVGNYMEEDGLARMIVPLELDGARVIDQRDPVACAALGIDPALSAGRWRPFLAAGREPPSWRNSDAARASGANGLIDPSRGIAGGWHVTLFRWNEPGAPYLRVAGPAVPCDYAAARMRWPAPGGWELPAAR